MCRCGYCVLRVALWTIIDFCVCVTSERLLREASGHQCDSPFFGPGHPSESHPGCERSRHLITSVTRAGTLWCIEGREGVGVLSWVREIWEGGEPECGRRWSGEGK